eukprot:6801464-Lingulodinium_polyedra.AAC.1
MATQPARASRANVWSAGERSLSLARGHAGATDGTPSPTRNQRRGHALRSRRSGGQRTVSVIGNSTMSRGNPW